MKGGSHKATELPYTNSSEGEVASADFLFPGGEVIYAKAGGTLLLGDLVFYSAKDTWNKSTTPANYAGYVGVVVGGRRTDLKILQDDALIGVLQVAAVGEEILVMVWGVAKVLADLAIAAVNTKVTGGSVTAGRASTTGAASGNFVGGTLDVAAGAASVIRLAVNAVG